MKFVKIALVSALVMVSTTGCALLKSAQDSPLVSGEPAIDGDVFLLTKQDPSLCQPDKTDKCTVMQPCPQEAAGWTSDKNQADINKCTSAMEMLIDERWGRFAHSMSATVANANFVIDTTTEAVNIAGTLTAAGTTKILTAIAAGLGGTKKNITDDLLYDFSIATIVQQMQTDREKKRQVIELRLAKGTQNPYPNMYDAAKDLYAFDQAGSWDAAMISLKTSAAAQAQACKDQSQSQQKTLAAKGVQGLSNTQTSGSGTCNASDSNASSNPNPAPPPNQGK